MTQRRLLPTVLAVAVIVIVLDQLAKWWTVTQICTRQPPYVIIIDRWFAFECVHNNGAAFNLGAGYTWIFTIIAACVAIFIVRTARKLGSVAWAIALGGMLGGLLGNLCDRLFRAPSPGMGEVVDFIHVHYWFFGIRDFPVFNVGDMAITGSAALMVILSLKGIEFGGPSSKEASAEDVEAEPDSEGAQEEGADIRDTGATS